MQSSVAMRAVQTLYYRGLKKKKEPNPGMNVGSNKMPQQRRINSTFEIPRIKITFKLFL